jgi:acetate kinase
MPEEEVIFSGIVEAIAEEGGIADHHQAIEQAIAKLLDSGVINSLNEIDAVGHRVVHGGDIFDRSVIIDEKVITGIDSLIQLAPIHNRANLEGIYAIQSYLCDVSQVAVFDTAFHQTLPKEAYCYALPLELCEKEYIRRYGFHGTSHHYVADKCAKHLKKELTSLNLITLHLGNGASACAIEAGKSVDTSMGFTPLEGLIMGTRCGDIDPAIVLYLQKTLHKSSVEIEHILNHESGLKGICGVNDMRIVEEMSKKGDKKAALAIDMFVRRVKKYIGSYIALLGHVDAIVFTGGIGEHSPYIREKILQNMEHLALVLDPKKNLSDDACISQKESKTALFVIPTDEELMIAKESYNILF